MRRAQPAGLASKWLPWIIRLTALGYLSFFVPDLLLATTHRIQGLPPVLARLFDWGNGGDAVAVMFATVYIVWAIFLFGSAREPLTHRLFLDFNLTANAAHFTAQRRCPSDAMIVRLSRCLSSCTAVSGDATSDFRWSSKGRGPVPLHCASCHWLKTTLQGRRRLLAAVKSRLTRGGRLRRPYSSRSDRPPRLAPSGR